MNTDANIYIKKAFENVFDFDHCQIFRDDIL